jgi:hypothetical protein
MNLCIYVHCIMVDITAPVEWFLSKQYTVLFCICLCVFVCLFARASFMIGVWAVE